MSTTRTVTGFGLAGRAATALLAAMCGVAVAEPARVVAIGASNTSGWGVGEKAAYPARLEALLRACGLDVAVVNAGVPFETTGGMLMRIDADVPDGTRLVILQPGGNDLRFFGSAERRAENLAAMQARLEARAIPALVYDPVFPPEDYQWDRIHITEAGHGWIARDLLPRTVDALAPKPRRGTRARQVKPGCEPGGG